MMDFRSFMESADAARQKAHAELERKLRKKVSKRNVETARSFTQTQKEKMAERGQMAADTKSYHSSKNVNKVTHTKGSASDLHRPFYKATKGAVKGSIKGAVKLAKKVMQRDSD